MTPLGVAVVPLTIVKIVASLGTIVFALSQNCCCFHCCLCCRIIDEKAQDEEDVGYLYLEEEKVSKKRKE